MSKHTGHGHASHDEVDWAVMGPMLERNAELGSPLYEEAARWIAAVPTAPEVRRVLDIGSGPGVITCLLAEVFPEAEVVAVDKTPALLERARDRAARHGLSERVRTLNAELPRDLGMLGEADLIWAGNALHHIGDQRGLLSGFAGLLRPGGSIALAEGGLPTRQLPRDIGIGRAGLETRLDAVTADWFDDMRAALPGAVREVEDWSALFTAVGLEPQGTRSFLLDLPAPLASTSSRGSRGSARCSPTGSRPRTSPYSTGCSTPTTRRDCATARMSSCSRRPPCTWPGGRTVRPGEPYGAAARRGPQRAC